MNIVVSGALGHISKPLTLDLIERGHKVTVISSKPERRAAIEAIGAQAAIGSIEDSEFLSASFKHADIAYCMLPPFDFFDGTKDLYAYWEMLAHSYTKAILHSGITKIIHLSSIGAHTDQGVGMLSAHHTVEKIFAALPESVCVKTMRPVGFYYNLFAFIPAIKNAGAILQNYGGDEKEPWVAPQDIASVIAEEMERPFSTRTMRYIASDEMSPNDLAALLGTAIGQPDLKWNVIADEAFQAGLIKAGFTEQSARGLTEMNAGRRGHLYDDYRRNKPNLGTTKLNSFAASFAAAYQQQ